MAVYGPIVTLARDRGSFCALSIVFLDVFLVVVYSGHSTDNVAGFWCSVSPEFPNAHIMWVNQIGLHSL